MMEDQNQELEQEQSQPEQEPAGLNPAMLLVVLALLGGIGSPGSTSACSWAFSPSS